MTSGITQLTAQVRKILCHTLNAYTATIDPGAIYGKMLRTRLAQALAYPDWPHSTPTLPTMCAAVEMVHSASLFHDDVIDGAAIRRGHPTLWKDFSPSGAVLIGDMLLCDAIQLLLQTGSIHYSRLFTAKVREVCGAEVRQELQLRGSAANRDTCMQVARGKTGPLFAFTAMACAGTNKALETALEEVGYRFGCAYQIADDLLDVTGSEAETGKTLGTDGMRGKFTLAHHHFRETQTLLPALLDAIAEPLRAWPPIQQRLQHFVDDSLSRFTHQTTHRYLAASA